MGFWKSPEGLASAPANDVYRAFARLGGQRGWLYMDWSWQIRGIVDRLFGGVGMRRGRRDSKGGPGSFLADQELS
jgi:Protein of unknown function (DUF2867)